MKFFENNENPIWFMRQAGRYMPEYRDIKEDFLDKCYTPEIAAKITLQPIKKFNFDAAIIFSDILVLLDALSYDVKFIKGKGPTINTSNFILENYDIEYFNEKTDKVIKAISYVQQELSNDKVLIGFAGAPFTVSCFLIEGKSINPFKLFKINEYIYSKQEEYSKIIDIITKYTIIYLQKQIDQGVKVIQLFDTFAGVLPKEMYYKWVIAPTRKIIKSLKGNVQFIGFPKFSGLLYADFVKNTDVNIVSVDSCVKLDWIKNNINCDIQGNLDPFLLCYGSKEEIKKAVLDIFNILENNRFIFNLGHGVLKDTPEDNVKFTVDLVKSLR